MGHGVTSSDLTAPFVLLDDARHPSAQCRLYTDPVAIVTARRPSEVEAALDALRGANRDGLHAAGYLTYEAGAGIGSISSGDPESAAPLLWFGLFRNYRALTSHEVERALPDPAGAWAGVPQPLIERDVYLAHVAAAKALIEAGDIYQANITFPARVAVAGHPLALYAGLRARSAAGYGAVVATGSRWLLSASPELFFTLEGDRLTTRPMKGTAGVDTDPALLALDDKQRAENMMIVDLLRNDLSRVSVPGSVEVPVLFAVESYPTLHQLTSTVTGDLAAGNDAIDALVALFPCGSITGAPKHRARQVIAQIEDRPRGVYTGAIGRIDAARPGPYVGASFNVAIRTLELDTGADVARLGLGAGIVADSNPADEWRECLAKGAFVASPRRFDLIETMRFDPLTGIALLDRHLARLAASADALGFTLDRHDVRNELQAATFRVRAPARVRLLLARGGATAIEVRAMPSAPTALMAVALVPLPVDAADFRLRHKTTDRRFYDGARFARPGAAEVVFVDRDGRVTEGSFTNVFVERDGRLVTPTLEHGLLGGVLRADFLATGRAIEGRLVPDDLRHALFVGNALRGLLPAVLVDL